MKLVNAAALMCFLLFVLFDIGDVLSRARVMETRDLVVHSVFDIGALGLLGYSVWCMFLRGPLGWFAQLKLLFSFAMQCLVMAGIAVFALDPWAAYAESQSDSPDRWASVLTSFAMLLIPTAILALLMRWSDRIVDAPAEAPRPKAKAEVAGIPEDEYYEPPEIDEHGYEIPRTIRAVRSAPSIGAPEPAWAPAPAPAPVPIPATTQVVDAVAPVRSATVALLRVQLARASSAKKSGKPKPAKYEAGIVGSAVCVVAGRFLVTAHHVLNHGQTRREQDQFYIVLEQGSGARHVAVKDFILEDASLDLAILEIYADLSESELPAMPITTADVPDGTPVLTVGYPAPPLEDLQIDAEGNYQSARMFLKSRVNAGIVSAQYADGRGAELHEFNLAWHHGESGGPVVRVEPPVAVFSVMQDHRPVQGPRGGMTVGPAQGRSLRAVEAVLRQLGANFV